MTKFKRPEGAPPIAPPSEKSRKLFAKARSEPDIIAEIHRSEIEFMKSEAKFYDALSPQTQKHRQAVLRDFEDFAKDHLGMEENEIWDEDTIIHSQMKYLVGLAVIGQDTVEDRVKVSTLYQTKYAFYWWNTHFVKGFSAIYHEWHVRLMKWIHQIAVEFGPSTASWQKNSLTDTELLMLFQAITDANRGVENLQQHYAAWVLAWVTGARPGSLTVAPGYSEKDTLPGGGERGFDDTFRWSHVKWFKDEGQVCFCLTLHYQKGFHDPDEEDDIDRPRKFLFLPIQSASARLELDLTLILLGIAIKRGLFSLDYVLNTDDVCLKADPIVNQQAVFVSADESDEIAPEVPMKEDALNPKLRDACIRVGLTARNTMYSFRRTASTEIVWGHGTEQVEASADHGMQFELLNEYHDTVGFEDVDIHGWRLGTKQMEREELSRKCLQGYQAVIDSQNGNCCDNLGTEVRERVESLMREEKEYIEVHSKVKIATDEVRIFLEGEEMGDIPHGYSNDTTGTYKMLLGRMDQRSDADDLLSRFHTAFYTQAITLRRLRKRLRSEVFDEITQEMTWLLKSAGQASLRMLTIKKGGISRKSRDTARGAYNDLESYAKAQLDAVESLRAENFGEFDNENLMGDNIWDEDVDIRAIDENSYLHEQLQNSRAGPSEWDRLADSTVLQVRIGIADEDAEGHVLAQDRIEFLKAFIGKKSRPSEGLQCFRCLLDPSCTEEQKNKKWDRALLNQHLRGDTHTRRTQLRNAFNDYKTTGSLDKLPCLLCAAAGETKEYSDSEAWLKHLAKHHPEELWEHEESVDNECMDVMEGAMSSKAKGKRPA